ncbi:MAG: monofunctional biosynthetic peptidoglycan transglycosylase [Chthoniobacterales bacterium]
MAEKHSAKSGKIRRFLKYASIAFLLLLIFPVLHIGLTRFINPIWSPMQSERSLKARFSGTAWHTTPVQWVSLEKIPVELIHYIWASEDQAFFTHNGFDMWQLKQAMDAAREGGHSIRGASTITMQCARSVYLWQDRSYVRKALEAYYTLWMELLLSKQRILELYLNHIELGAGIYGVGAAAQEYYGKTPDQLSKNEMLSLAAILPNPLKWSPVHQNAMVQRKIARIQRLASRAPFPKEELKSTKD